MAFQAMQHWLQGSFNQQQGKVDQLTMAAGKLSEQAGIGRVNNSVHLLMHAFPASTPGWAVGWEKGVFFVHQAKTF